ncbi:cysteine--tRNA ligase [Helicobacter canis]|uniref:Cysteine--tRNA ligase n=1 Tax=Helicobacter canis NCTC 12740 TaxID=1357399 RepID=V8CGH6_9HELI|nr:cysteine--tRNA ligase [Helicobacter canis]ETD26493.1 cysteine-tRNA ligase [Helicobacter canis NCTC 12740]
MKIYDTRVKKKLEFIPLKDKAVRIYVCGPTVYDDAHLGHARSSIAFDLLCRTLKASGYDVLFVKNFTDIDDKIIKKAKDSGTSVAEVAESYIQAYLRDMDALLVRRPDIMPKATENLSAMTALITKLLDKDIAYKLPNGDIYLNVPKDVKYGEISGRGVDDESQARIHNDEQKRDVRDFALWKSYKGVEDVGYESVLGLGRPGWHIECSAMIEEVLAYQDKEFAIDIHGGGADLLFPHHENEACQSRCATGRELAKYWMHNGFVNIDGQKMSKSLGNSFYIKDALKQYSGEVVRNYLLGTHYRAVLHFNEEDLLLAKKRLDKIYRLKQRVASGFGGGLSGARAAMQGSNIALECKFCDEVLESMRDDLNISKALSVLEDMIHSANTSLDSTPKDKELKLRILASLDFVWELLGIGGGDCVEYFQQGLTKEQKAHIQEQIDKRAQAKKARDFARADAIRAELESMGIVLSDTSEGTIWERALE